MNPSFTRLLEAMDTAVLFLGSYPRTATSTLLDRTSTTPVLGEHPIVSTKFTISKAQDYKTFQKSQTQTRAYKLVGFERQHRPINILESEFEI